MSYRFIPDICNGSVNPAYPLLFTRLISKLPQHLTLISACACSKAPGARCTAYNTKRGSSQRSGEMCSMAPAPKGPCPHTYHHLLKSTSKGFNISVSPSILPLMGKTGRLTDWNATKQVSQSPSAIMSMKNSIYEVDMMMSMIISITFRSLLVPLNLFTHYTLFTLRHFSSFVISSYLMMTMDDASK